MDKFQNLTFTKRIVIVLLTIGLIDLQLSYFLSFLGKDSAEQLSIAIVTYILGVVVSYMLKAFFGKREEEKTRLEEKMMDFNMFNQGIEFEDVQMQEDTAE